MNLQWHGFWYLLRRDCGQFRWEAPFFFTSAVLMRLDNGTIHGKFLQLSIKAQDTEDIIQDAILYPFAEAAVNSLPWAITLWQVAPWSTTASDPHQSVDNGTVIFSWAALFTSILRRK